jgi:alpha-mannosidase
LVRGKGPHTALALDRLALEMQTPAEYIIDSAHEGSEPREKSFLEITPATVEVTALKRAESGEGIIVRLQERAGHATEARLQSAVFSMDHRIALAPWQLKTLRITPATRNARIGEISITEQ